MKIAKLAHDGASLGFMAGILLVVLLPVLMGTGTVQKILPFAHPASSTNTFSGNPPYTPPQSSREQIPNGTYAGWTQYHHNVLGFSVNVPPGITATELPQTRAETPRYPEFMLQLSYNENGVEIEFGRITVYDSKFAVNTKAQEQSTDPLFAATPTKTDGRLLGRTSVQYFYQGNVRTVVYLIDDNSRTFEVRGFVDATNPQAVNAYWDRFNSVLASFAID